MRRWQCAPVPDGIQHANALTWPAVVPDAVLWAGAAVLLGIAHAVATQGRSRLHNLPLCNGKVHSGDVSNLAVADVECGGLQRGASSAMLRSNDAMDT